MAAQKISSGKACNSISFEDFEKMQSDAASDFDAMPVSVAIERLGLPGSTFYKYADNLKIKTFRKNRRGWVTNTDFKKLKDWIKNKPDGRKKSSSERNSGEKEEIKTRPECSVEYYKVDEFRDGHWWVFRCGFSQQEAETLAAELSVSGALFRASPHKIRRETGNLFKKIAEKELKRF